MKPQEKPLHQQYTERFGRQLTALHAREVERLSGAFQHLRNIEEGFKGAQEGALQQTARLSSQREIKKHERIVRKTTARGLANIRELRRNLEHQLRTIKQLSNDPEVLGQIEMLMQEHQIT